MKLAIFDLVRCDLSVWARVKKRPSSFFLFMQLVLLEPGFQMVFLFRLREFAVRVPLVGRFVRRLMWYWSTIWFGSDVGVDLQCAGGLYCPHPFGIVINGQCRIGQNVTILQGVTLGISDDAMEAPNILDGSYLGAGSTVLGRTVVGPFAKVGAGAVVLVDVPQGETFVGVPARAAGRDRSVTM